MAPVIEADRRAAHQRLHRVGPPGGRVVAAAVHVVAELVVDVVLGGGVVDVFARCPDRAHRRRRRLHQVDHLGFPATTNVGDGWTNITLSSQLVS